MSTYEQFNDVRDQYTMNVKQLENNVHESAHKVLKERKYHIWFFVWRFFGAVNDIRYKKLVGDYDFLRCHNC